MTTNNDIHYTHAFARLVEDKIALHTIATFCFADSVPVVVMRREHFDVMATDAERWRKHVSLAEKEEHVAEVAARADATMPAVEDGLRREAGDGALKVSRGYALRRVDDGCPVTDSLSENPILPNDRPCVVAWADDFDDLARKAAQVDHLNETIESIWAALPPTLQRGGFIVAHVRALAADAKAWREQRAREPKIKTPCPSCGSQSLFVPENGLLTCSVIGCNAPAMINDMAMERRKQMETTNETPRPTLVGEIKNAINRHNRESASHTPDFILADYILRALEAFEHASRERENWYGRSLSVGGGYTLPTPAPTLAERFPVGRNVRVTRCAGWVGKSGQIESVAAEVLVRLSDGRIVGFAPDEIELLPEGPTPSPWVPSKGDLIRTISTQETGVFLRFAGFSGRCVVRLDGFDESQVQLDDIEPVPPTLALAHAAAERIKESPVVPDATWRERMADDLSRTGSDVPTPEPTGPNSTADQIIRKAKDLFDSLFAWSDDDGQITLLDRVRRAGQQVAALRGKLAAVERALDEARGMYQRTCDDLHRMCGREGAATTHSLDYATILSAKMAKLERERDEARADVVAARQFVIDEDLASYTDDLSTSLKIVEHVADGWQKDIETRSAENDRTREAEAFEREAFIVALGSLCANNDEAISVTQARSVAAAARAAMFPGEGKA